jgi:hypothetical protein
MEQSPITRHLRHCSLSSISRAIRVRDDIFIYWTRPGHKTKWSAEEFRAAISMIEENPIFALEEIIQLMVSAGYRRITRTALHRYLEFQLNTYEMLINRSELRNHSDTKAAQAE